MIANPTLPLRMKETVPRHTKQNLYHRFIHLSLHSLSSMMMLVISKRDDNNVVNQPPFESLIRTIKL